MAASDPHPRPDRPQQDGVDCLTPTGLRARLEEEISRAERHRTRLSCLLVVIENLEEIAQEHGSELREQTMDYVAGALRRELRRFDRVGPIGRGGRGGPISDHDLLIILPGADGPRAEIVARRALERLRTIKVEVAGARRALHISVGLAAWREDVSAESLLARARAALRSVNGDEGFRETGGAAMHARQPSAQAPTRAHASIPPVLGRAGGP